MFHSNPFVPLAAAVVLLPIYLFGLDQLTQQETEREKSQVPPSLLVPVDVPLPTAPPQTDPDLLPEPDPDPAPPLPLPHTLSSPEYQQYLYPFLANRRYIALGWKVDKAVRDTGPFIDGTAYSTHTAVRIWYSPEVITWLEGGRRGRLPDGAMIIKEMFTPPAARYADSSGAALDSLVNGWAVMVRDSIGSKDGWYWSYYAPGQPIDNPAAYPYDYPNSGFGSYCVRCHASAEDEFTFSSLRNVAGYPGDPITFRVDNSWIPGQNYVITPEKSAQLNGTHGRLAAEAEPGDAQGSGPSGPEVNHDFLRMFNQMPPVDPKTVRLIPGVSYDHVYPGPGGPDQFMTSDQCLSCHDGQGPPFGPNMYIPDPNGKNVNLSPYGEWNWSMMGLAGRDPIFYSQIESEMNLYPDRAALIQNLCFRCHGVMGQRQLAIDHPAENFTVEIPYVHDEGDRLYRYGALARDGVSCTVCHQIVDDKLPLDSIVTGQFHVSHPGEFEQGMSNIYGPFDEPKSLAMRSSLGLNPVQSDYISSSRLCGSCHSVLLPVFDTLGQQIGETFEQATYLEWQNSQYQNEFGSEWPNAKTCQNCHMPTTYPFLPDDYSGDQRAQSLAFRIANIQDETYPEADERAPIDSINLEIRPDFARHSLLGINIFALEMFNQFDSILGVRVQDYMTYSKNGLPFAIETSTNLARNHTARINVGKLNYSNGEVETDITVTNLTGHRFPSGVGFRRAFLEVKVLDASGNVLWISGGTDDVGVILGENGAPLPSEFFAIDPATGQEQYQPHHREITDQNQVQIYQELVKDSRGKFTTSFLGIATHVKDNRLLPIGWTMNGPKGFQYAKETRPVGDALTDKDFIDGKGSDRIRYRMNLKGKGKPDRVVATLYYQSIPPYYLRQRFMLAPNGSGTQRLYFLASHLQTDGTAIEDWKLMVGMGVARF